MELNLHTAMFAGTTSVSADGATPHNEPGTGYDIIANEYYDARHITSRNFDAATRAYLHERSFLLPSDGFALDLGAGKGRLYEYCGVPAARIIQTDISERMLKLRER